MNEDNQAEADRNISLEAQRQIDSFCDEFEKAFRDEEHPQIEDYLVRLAVSLRPHLLKELLGVETELLNRGADVDSLALAALVDVITAADPAPRVLRGQGRGGVRVAGRLVGGSLTLVAASIGTPWEIDTRNTILLLEDRGEFPHRVDRMLQQLRGSGKLEAVVGIGLGDFASCVDDRYPNATAESIVGEVVRPLGIPLVTGLPFGHCRNNQPWPVGGRATLNGETGELQILEPGVTRKT